MKGEASSLEREELLCFLANDEKLRQIHTVLFAPSDSSPPDMDSFEYAYRKQLKK